jgi:hypothetical protein
MLIFLAFARPVEAQIRIGLKVEHETVLQYETVRVFITIYNDSKQTLVIDKEYGDFVLEPFLFNMAKEPVELLNKRPICKELRIRAGAKETVMVDISNWYNFSRIGGYDLEIFGLWKDVKFKSNRVHINVVSGFELASFDKNLSGYTAKIRHYSLRYWKRGNAEHLFLRIDEPENKMNYGVYDLGKIIRFFKPILKVDADDNIKVIHQIGFDCYKKTLFSSTPDSVTFVDQSYHLDSGAPYPNMRAIKAE